MPSEAYSTTPPTEDGWYWVRFSDGWENPCCLHGGRWLWAVVPPGSSFFRIPSAEELVEMRAELQRLTDPTPLTEQVLRDVAGFTSRGKLHGLHRGSVRAMSRVGGWLFGIDAMSPVSPRSWSWAEVNPQPKTLGHLWQLLDRMEEGNA